MSEPTADLSKTTIRRELPGCRRGRHPAVQATIAALIAAVGGMTACGGRTRSDTSTHARGGADLTPRGGAAAGVEGSGAPSGAGAGGTQVLGGNAGRSAAPNGGARAGSAALAGRGGEAGRSEPSLCGDGWLDEDEECDDGNTYGDDGCSATCTLEWFDCVPLGCWVVACGDGKVEGDEMCDDGNATSGDGCDATCAIEAGYRCLQPGQRCQLVATCAETAAVPSPPDTCERLVAAQPEVVRVAWDGADMASPQGLASAIDDGRCVSVLTARLESDSGHATLQGLSFEPWTRWPASGWLGGAVTLPLDAEPAGPFAVGPSDAGQIALGYQRRDGGTSFGWDLSPSELAGSYRDVAAATEPIAVTVADFGHSLGVLDQTGYSLRTWGPGSYGLHGQACASPGGVVGDVEPSGAVLLAVAATGANNTWGCSAVADPGPPTQITVVSLTGTCCESHVANFDAGGTVVALRSATHPDGLWVVWQVAEPGDAPLRWARIADGGVAARGVVTAPTPIAFDVAQLGRDLAIGWGTATAEPRVAVTVIDEAGESTLRYANSAPPSGTTLRLFAAAAGRGLLLAYGPDALTRLDCAP